MWCRPGLRRPLPTHLLAITEQQIIIGHAGSMNNQIILLEDGWNKLKTGGVQKIEDILEDMQGGVYKNRISTDEYSQLYT